MRSSKLVLLIALISVCAPALAYDWSTNPGDGSPENPYQISTPEHLMSIGADPVLLTKHYILTNDIIFDPNNNPAHVFTEALIAPDSDQSSGGFQGNEFTGTFNGNNHSICGLHIQWADYIGLFGSIGATGRIHNLIMIDITVKGFSVVGGLAALNKGRIETCSVTGSVTGYSDSGGMVGSNEGTLIACRASGTLTGYQGNIGGLCGTNWNGVITRSSGQVDVTGSVNSRQVGGLCGNNDSGSIHDSAARGAVSGYAEIGGLCGMNFRGTVSHSSADSVVSGTESVGGLCGLNEFRAVITTCSAAGQVNGSFRYIGGLCGSNSFLSTLQNCVGQASVTGNYYTGGLCGYNSDSSIEYSYAGGQVSGSDSVGGLCGSNWLGAVTLSYADGPVYCNYDYAGGFCGKNEGGSISSSYAAGSVRGRSYVGGFCGFNSNSSILESYACGSVDGTGSYVGGFSGPNTGTITACFWDTDRSARTISGGGVGKTTIQMKAQSTFTSYGWDFLGESTNGQNEIWRMCADGIDYPRLSWEFAQQGDFACADGTDLADLLALAEHWLMTEADTPTAFSFATDANADTQTNLADLAVLSDNWP